MDLMLGEACRQWGARGGEFASKGVSSSSSVAKACSSSTELDSVFIGDCKCVAWALTGTGFHDSEGLHSISRAGASSTGGGGRRRGRGRGRRGGEGNEGETSGSPELEPRARTSSTLRKKEEVENETSSISCRTKRVNDAKPSHPVRQEEVSDGGSFP